MPNWQKLFQTEFSRQIDEIQVEDHKIGELSEDWLLHFNKILSIGNLDEIDGRIILFVEIVDPEGFIEERALAQQLLVPSLPERMCIVLCGLPDDVTLGSTGDQFLELDWHDQQVDSQRAANYQVSYLQDDLPAEEDRLGIGNYAVGMARLILHQSSRPLTIGIQAPWGKGKSSFMRFVENALIRWAPINDIIVQKSYNPILTRMKENAQSIKEIQVSEPLTSDSSAMDGLKRERGNLKWQYDGVWHQMKQNAISNVLSVHFNSWQDEDANQIWAGVASCVSQKMEQVMHHQLKSRKPGVRVVVFMDDLDRCSDSKIMEMLQAIHLILGGSDFFVLMGIDTDMLYRAIRSHYRKQSLEYQNANDLPETYLRKIIQLPQSRKAFDRKRLWRASSQI